MMGRAIWLRVVVALGACAALGGCLPAKSPEHGAARRLTTTIQAPSSRVCEAVFLVIGDLELKRCSDSCTSLDGIVHVESGLGQRVVIEYEMTGEKTTELRLSWPPGPCEDWLPQLLARRIQAQALKPE